MVTRAERRRSRKELEEASGKPAAMPADRSLLRAQLMQLRELPSVSTAHMLELLSIVRHRKTREALIRSAHARGLVSDLGYAMRHASFSRRIRHFNKDFMSAMEAYERARQLDQVAALALKLGDSYRAEKIMELKRILRVSPLGSGSKYIKS